MPAASGHIKISLMKAELVHEKRNAAHFTAAYFMSTLTDTHLGKCH